MGTARSVVLGFVVYAACSCADNAPPLPSDPILEPSWQEGPRMLSPVVSAEAVEAEGTIFVGGGVPFGNGMEVFRLDSERDRWTRVANLPVSRTNYALAAYGDSLYAIGGSVFVIGEGQVPQPSVFVYSIERDRWVDGIAMPEGRAHHATTVVGERIVVLGGIREFGRSTKLAVYDLTTGQWSEGAALTRDGASLRD